ncbi:MAG: hypothetical protein HS113_21100 [Verrucomicrobiales bacterium]|nr:hypothetical protein [Verrucomicrobiales bacterium]
MIPPTIRVRLLRAHIINGQTFPAGRVVNLSAASAAIILDCRVGELADPKPSVAAPEPSLPSESNPNP